MTAAATTVYEVQLRYLMDAKRASGGLRTLNSDMQRATRSNEMLRSGFRRLATAAVGAFGIVQAKRHLLDYNAEMEQARIQMAGMLQLNTGGEFNDNMKKSVDLVAELQQRAKASVGTTKDFVQMASMVVRPLAAANIPMEKMGELVQGAVVASRAFGIEAGMAARDVESALMGQLRSVDRFARALLEPMGYAGDDGRARFNAMSAQERAATLQTALTQRAIADMARAQETSFDGVISTFEDNLQIAIGRTGKGLFQSITDEVRSWNKWIDQNGQTLERIGREFGETLVTGFEMVKSVMAFVIEHKDLLLTIAKMWIGAKLVGGGLSALNGGIATVNGLMASFRSLTGVLSGSGGVVSMLGAAGPLALAIGAAAGLITHFASVLEDNARRTRELTDTYGIHGVSGIRKLNVASAQRRAGDFESMKEFAGQAAGFFKKAGIVSEDGTYQGAKVVQELKEVTQETRDMLALQFHAERFGFNADMSPKQQAALLAEAIRKEFTAIQRAGGEDVFSTARAQDTISEQAQSQPGKGKADIKVTINRVEVQSDDPDRFVMKLGEVTADALRFSGVPFGAMGGA